MLQLIIAFLLGLIIYYTILISHENRDYIYIPISFILMVLIIATITLTGVLLFGIGSAITIGYYIIKELKRNKK